MQNIGKFVVCKDFDEKSQNLQSRKQLLESIINDYNQKLQKILSSSNLLDSDETQKAIIYYQNEKIFRYKEYNEIDKELALVFYKKSIFLANTVYDIYFLNKKLNHSNIEMDFWDFIFDEKDKKNFFDQIHTKLFEYSKKYINTAKTMFEVNEFKKKLQYWVTEADINWYSFLSDEQIVFLLKQIDIKLDEIEFKKMPSSMRNSLRKNIWKIAV